MAESRKLCILFNLLYRRSRCSNSPSGIREAGKEVKTGLEALAIGPRDRVYESVACEKRILGSGCYSPGRSQAVKAWGLRRIRDRGGIPRLT
jgi:hypothetical protein